jgi:hypothetical protein
MAISAGKATVGGAALGVAGGGGGAYAIFQLVNLKEILTTNGTPMSILAGLGIFSLLALFAVFTHARVVQADASGGDINQKSAVYAFVGVVVVTVGVLGYLTLKNEPLKLTTNFRNYKSIHAFKFTTDPAGPETTVNATINDGNPHDFDQDGNLDLNLTTPSGKITVDVDGLSELQTAYRSYNTVLNRQTELQQNCHNDIFTSGATGDCAKTLRNILPSALLGTP